MEMLTDRWEDYIAQYHYSISSEFRRTYVLFRVITSCLTMKNSRILEVGCGSAITAFALSDHGYSVTCIDNNDHVLELIEREHPFFKKYISFYKADGDTLPFENNSFDLAYSQGLLEHYQDSQIVELLLEQSRVAKIVVLDVPNSRHSNNRLRGDERLLSVKKYHTLCREANLKVVAVYGRRWLPGLGFLDEVAFLKKPSWTWFCAQNSILVCYKIAE